MPGLDDDLLEHCFLLFFLLVEESYGAYALGDS